MATRTLQLLITILLKIGATIKLHVYDNLIDVNSMNNITVVEIKIKNDLLPLIT